MKTISIQGLRGMSTNEALATQGYAKYSANMDVWGLGDNTSKVSLPGVLQSMKIMVAGTEAAATNDVTDVIKHFTYFVGGSASSATAGVWGMSAETSPRLYYRDSGAWTLQRSTAGADLTTALTSGNIASFRGRLFTAQNARISSWDGSTWIASYQTLSTSTAPHPMKIIAGKLAVADGPFVATFDGSLNWTAAALTIATEFTIRSMEMFGDRLYIFADNGSFSRMFVWDGTSQNYLSYFDLEHSTAPYITFSDGVLWVIPPINQSPSTPIYTFNGSSFTKVLSIPYLSVQENRDALLPYRSGLILISNNNSTAFEDGTAGLWLINKHTSGDQYQYGIGFAPGGGLTTTNVGGAIVFGTNIYVGTNNSSNFQVFEVSNADTATGTGFWQSLPFRGDDPAKQKFWHSVQLHSDLKNDTNTSIVVKYRLDNVSSWTTLVTVANSNDIPNRKLPIGKTSRSIELRFELVTPGGTQSTRLRAFSLQYDEKTL
jgi:hypothetical protein